MPPAAFVKFLRRVKLAWTPSPTLRSSCKLQGGKEIPGANAPNPKPGHDPVQANMPMPIFTIITQAYKHVQFVPRVNALC